MFKFNKEASMFDQPVTSFAPEEWLKAPFWEAAIPPTYFNGAMVITTMCQTLTLKTGHRKEMYRVTLGVTIEGKKYRVSATLWGGDPDYPDTLPSKGLSDFAYFAEKAVPNYLEGPLNMENRGKPVTYYPNCSNFLVDAFIYTSKRQRQYYQHEVSFFADQASAIELATGEHVGKDFARLSGKANMIYNDFESRDKIQMVQAYENAQPAYNAMPSPYGNAAPALPPEPAQIPLADDEIPF